MAKGTLNKAILIGRLGKDPEIRATQSGGSVVSFSVATNHSQKNAQGEWNDITEWHNIVVFGNRAEFAGKYLSKGQLVYIEGRLQTSSWEDQNGQKKYKTEVIANDLQMLGSKSDNSAQTANSAPLESNNAGDGGAPF
jgi:single-strand DNA-binding protein